MSQALPDVYRGLILSYAKDLTCFTCSCGESPGVPKSFCETCLTVIFNHVFMEGWRAALQDIQDSR